ncbi:sigma-70 family RNA polymerase sigma factor [Gordonia caeni]|uniref:RNA polymerase sigma factor n=2 Tax=Gordonia caeni TaxID=1007097 RepID=A0ABP7NJU7_9ACTN
MNDLNHSRSAGGDFEMNGFSDEELAAAAAAGDPEAFDQLISRTAPILLRFVRRMVDDAQVAEDIAQETLLAVWRGLPDFAFRSRVRTWILGIAHRKVVDHYRRHRDYPTDGQDFESLASAEPLPSDQAERAELVVALRAELTQLPPTSRAVWWLREVEGLSLAEISGVLGISNGSVRGHLQRSRAFLTTRLAPWRPGAGGPAAPEEVGISGERRRE